MKRFFLIVAALAIMSFGYAQEAENEKTDSLAVDSFRVSLNVGSTAGDQLARDHYSANIGFEFSYYYRVSRNFMVGPSVGLTHIFKKDMGGQIRDLKSEVKFADFGGGFRLYTDNNRFFIGADAGYTYGLDEGGFCYKPKLGISLCERSGIIFTFADVSDTFNYSYASMGYELSF